MLAINGGRHVNPLFAGDTLYAWSEVLDKAEIRRRRRAAAASRRDQEPDRAPAFPCKNDAGEYDPAVMLDFDYWAAIPKRG